MATITLKTGTFTLPNGQTQELSTLQFIKGALESTGEKGLTIKDILARGRVDRALDALIPGETELTLNDADTETLKQAMETVKWGIRPPVLTSLIEELYPEVVS